MTIEIVEPFRPEMYTDNFLKNELFIHGSKLFDDRIIGKNPNQEDGFDADWDFSVGDIVYANYTPQNPGVIIEIYLVEHWTDEYTVKNHKPCDCSCLYNIAWNTKKKYGGHRGIVRGEDILWHRDSLTIFDTLINDHESKLARHLANRKKIVELATKLGIKVKPR